MLEKIHHNDKIDTDTKTAMVTERDKPSSFGFWFVTGIVLIVIDQISKIVAERNSLSIFQNTNFAFSLPVPVLLMYGIYIIVLVGIIRYLMRNWSKLNQSEKISWTLILAGGLSNIIERLTLGYVRDFIPVLNGILNIADFYIIFGLVLLLVRNKK